MEYSDRLGALPTLSINDEFVSALNHILHYSNRRLAQGADQRWSWIYDPMGVIRLSLENGGQNTSITSISCSNYNKSNIIIVRSYKF